MAIVSSSTFFGDYFDDQHYDRLGQRSELYNLREDIGETRDLAGAEPERVASPREQLLAWIKSIPAEVPGDNPHHDPTRELPETKQRQPWNKGPTC